MSAGAPSPTVYTFPGMAVGPGGPAIPSPTPPTPYAAPPAEGPESRSPPGAPGGNLPALSPLPTPYATPSTQGPLSGPSPAPTPYPAISPYGPTISGPPAYAPPPPPYSPRIASTPTSPASSPPTSPASSPPTSPASSPPLTLPSDAVLVYAPSPTPITFPSPTPSAYPYHSPGPASQGTSGASPSPSPSPSPSQGGGRSYSYPSPTLVSASPQLQPCLFGPPSAICGSSPSNPEGPLSAPSMDLCAYGGSSYYVPYSQGVGGYMVPCPRRTSSSPAPYPGRLPISPTPPGALGYPSPVVSPTPARLPVYYGLPVTCPPGAASCRPGPYAYYAVRGTDPLTPSDEAALLGQSPSARSPSPHMYLSPASDGRMAPSPRAVFPPAPAPSLSMGPAIAPAPGPTAQCACDPTDVTPRSVKLEVLSTAYNSTTSDTIKFNAYLTFSHPTRSLNSSQVRVFTRQPSDDMSGTVTTPGVVSLLQPVRTMLCIYVNLNEHTSAALLWLQMFGNGLSLFTCLVVTCSPGFSASAFLKGLFLFGYCRSPRTVPSTA